MVARQPRQFMQIIFSDRICFCQLSLNIEARIYFQNKRAGLITFLLEFPEEIVSLSTIIKLTAKIEATIIVKIGYTSHLV